MFDHTQGIFPEISKALYRAAMFVSYIDKRGRGHARAQEIEVVSNYIKVMQEQYPKETFVYELMSFLEGGIREISKEGDSCVGESENIPIKVEEAMKTVLDNFDKSEARLYASILLALSASVAQAHDEKDDFARMENRWLSFTTIFSNIQPIYHRILMFLSDTYNGERARKLYEPDDIFDQMKISTKESDALGLLSGAIKKAWIEKYPEDMKQTVKEHLQMSSENHEH